MLQDRLVHVVDDDDAVRRSLDFMLRSAGFQVQRWDDGIAFLKGVDRSRHACVLLDIRMPGMDGLEVQAAMAERGINIPVIVLTGHGDISIAVRAMRMGAVDFLEKPFSRDRLLEAIEIALAQQSDKETQRQRAQWATTQVAGLTEREREVLEGLACGYPNKTIAYDLAISPRTVEVYRANVMAKLDVTNFADALRVAFAAGMGSEEAWKAQHLVVRPHTE